MALLDAIADPLRLQIVRRLAGRPPLTLSELADALDVHLNTVRSHVAELEDIGVLVGHERPAEGRGRRPTEYSLAEDQLLASSDLSGLSELLAAAVARSGLDKEQLVALGAEWGRFLAGRPGLRDPLDAVPQALERLGFDATATESAIEVHGCPCAVLSPDRPEVICYLTHGVIEGALAATGSQRRIRTYVNDPQQRTCRAIFDGNS